MNVILMIDVPGLLNDVSPEKPCGEDLELDPDFRALEQAAEEKAEQQFGDSVVEAEGADWRTVKKLALALLLRTKDLRIAVYLTRALLVTDNLAGFQSGLSVVHGLIDKYWDHMHPELDPDDDNDPTMRMNTLLNLCGQGSMLKLLRHTEIVNAKGLGRYTFGDFLAANGRFPAPPGDQPPAAISDIDAAFLGSELEDIETRARAVQASIALVETIDTEVTAKVGETNAVSMTPLVEMLKELNDVMSGQLARRGVGEVAEAVVGEAPTAVAGEVRTREDVIRLLDQACEYFERHEPSSPIPILLKRAKNLVHKDFLEIIRDIAPGGVQEVEKIRGADPK